MMKILLKIFLNNKLGYLQYFMIWCSFLVSKYVNALLYVENAEQCKMSKLK